MRFISTGRAVAALGLGALLAGLLPCAARAHDVKAGLDYFETATDPTSYQDFATTPIPPNFFDPGSDAFTGIITFKGVPIDPAQSSADTIIRRLERARLGPPFPVSDTIAIRFAALSLTSKEPITVTYNGGQDPEPWLVDVGLSESRQPKGSMTITHVKPAGKHQQSGIFDVGDCGTRTGFAATNGFPAWLAAPAWLVASTWQVAPASQAFDGLPVLPRFKFTRVRDGAVRILDTGQLGFPPVVFCAANVPWKHACTRGFFCGSDDFCPSCGSSGQRVVTTEQEETAQHAVCPPIPADVVHFACP